MNINIEETVPEPDDDRTDDHDWHLFDVLRNLEVRQTGDTYEVRPVGDPGGVTTMTTAEFDRFRTEEPEPLEEDADGDESEPE